MKIFAWETTRRCQHSCIHCRAAADDIRYDNELSTEEGRQLIDSISSNVPSLLILTGGEPLLRDDIYELANYANSKKIRVVMAPCGSSITEPIVDKLKNSGVSRISLSLDGINAEMHDSFRVRNGSFDEVINAAKISRCKKLEFQINTTITKNNIHCISEINDLADSLGAVIHDIFLLVPTGRGAGINDLALSKKEYDGALKWIAEEVVSGYRKIKVTCAPQYSKVYLDTVKKLNKKPVGTRPPTGCLAGKSFIFISHTGEIQPCGFFNLPCGNIRNHNCDVHVTIRNSNNLKKILDQDSYKGKCKSCNLWNICKGCRARVFALKGDFTEEDSYCNY